jgi:hypothetical protein
MLQNFLRNERCAEARLQRRDQSKHRLARVKVLLELMKLFSPGKRLGRAYFFCLRISSS